MDNFTISDAILIMHDLKRIDNLKYPEGYHDLQELIKIMMQRMERIRLKEHKFYKFLKDLLKGYRVTGNEEATDSEPIMNEDFLRTIERLQAFKTYLLNQYNL